MACSPPPITSRSRYATATPSGSPAATGSRRTSRTCTRSSTIRKSCRPDSSGNTTATITPSSRTRSWRRSTSSTSSAISSCPRRRPASTVSFAAPDLFVPEEEEEAGRLRKPPQFFKPLRLNREVSVQPLLTPDNYAENALKLIKSAKKSVWFQNQYINFRGTERRLRRIPAAGRRAQGQDRQGARRPHHLPRHDEAGEPGRADRARLPEGYSASSRPATTRRSSSTARS